MRHKGEGDSDRGGLTRGVRGSVPASSGPDVTVARYAMDETRRIAREVLEGQPVALYLFGSWARGDARRTSDIDLAVDARGPVDKYALTLLRMRLEESTIPYRVDVVDLRQVSEEFRERVMREGIPW